MGLSGLYLAGWMLLDYLSYLTEVTAGVSPWYLPHGLSIAFILFAGRRFIPLLAVGPMINGSLFWLPGEWAALIPLSLGILLSYGACGWYLRWRRVDLLFPTVRDVAHFLVAGLAASIAAAALCVGALVQGGALAPSEYLATAGLFWAGDTLGVFGLAPFFYRLMACAHAGLRPARRAPGATARAAAPRNRLLPLLPPILLVGGISTQTFGIFDAPPLYLLVFPVLWIAFQRGSEGAAYAVAAANAGPMAALLIDPGFHPSLAAMQLEVSVVSIAGIALGAAIEELRRKEAELASAQERGKAATQLGRAHSQLRERMKELRCLYRVLQLTTDDRRSLAEVGRETAVQLARSMLHDDQAVARVVIEGREFRSHDPSVLLCRSIRRRIRDDRRTIGYVEVGYPTMALEGGPPDFLPEEDTLVESVAVFLGRMITARKTHDQLAQSERLKAVGQLTGGIAHDFNNLLTVIIGNTETLLERMRGRTDDRDLAEMTLNAAERGAELTDQLLSFARRQPLEPHPVRLGKLLDGMLPLLRRTLGEQIEVGLSGDLEEATAEADRAQLESAILNLCINARDAMADGGRLVLETGHVRIQRPQGMHDLAPGDYVTLAVRDTGVGMDADTARRCLEPFFTTKEPGKGSGLGLSMVYGFAIQSGGHLSIESAQGEGTSATLWLPSAQPRRAEASSGRTRPESAVGTERLLVVDDHPMVRQALDSMLVGLGYDVTLAADGQQALALLDRVEPHLLLTDVVMPGGMSGFDLAREAWRRRPGLPVIFASGYSDGTKDVGDVGAERFLRLSKPFRRDELAKALRQALDLTPSCA